MAYGRNYNNYKNRYNKSKKKNKYTKVEHTAYLMGLVKRGLKNSESKISESYNKGLNSAEIQKKSLF